MIDIETPRLILRLVPLAGLAATASLDHAACRRLIGNVPPEWFADEWVAGMRLTQWKANPDYAPWSIRAIVMKSTGAIAGYMNCHDVPFMHDGTQTIELGYTVFEPFRRCGIATEAILGFTSWASAQKVHKVLLSISPDNAASRALALKLGGRKIGSQIDEKDGPEDIYAFDISASTDERLR